MRAVRWNHPGGDAELSTLAPAATLRANTGRRYFDSVAGHMLQEALPAPEQAWVEGPDGRFITELIVPLVLRPDQSPAIERPNPSRGTSPVPAVARADRLRAPGSDWLFVKAAAAFSSRRSARCRS
jgi:lantibiotic biosynthesis protein